MLNFLYLYYYHTLFILLHKSERNKRFYLLSPKGTSPLGVVTPLPFDHVALINIYSSSYREAAGANLHLHKHLSCYQLLVSNILC